MELTVIYYLLGVEVGKKFRELKEEAYYHCIDNYKSYTDFNTLGLYRSITENTHLNPEARIRVRDYANSVFRKTFNFLQLKDPATYFELTTLGMDLTRAQEWQVWDKIRQGQQKILKDKKLKHRNFGTYSKHNCGMETCPYNNLMIKQGSLFAENIMWFHTDRHTKNGVKEKAKRIRKERKDKHRIIHRDLDEES